MSSRRTKALTRRDLNCRAAAALAAGFIVSRTTHADEAGPGRRRSNAPQYRIYPLRNGLCRVRGDHAYFEGDKNRICDYALYTWLILGGEKPIMIDAGIEDVAEMNRGAAHVLYEPISQTPEEATSVQLKKFGLTAADIGHVFITHLHFDHVDELLKYTNAQIHIGRKEWTLATANDCIGSWGHGRIMFTLRDDPDWNKRMNLVEDEEVLPGFESFWVGGHTPGSTAYRINTAHGKVVCTGDTVSLLDNMERPVGVFGDINEVKAAIPKIRDKANIILASHDPQMSYTWPPLPKGTPRYRIRAIKVGECDVIDGITFQDRFHDKTTRKYFLYIWLIEGGDKPMIVDTGPNPLYLGDFNNATKDYIPGGVRQTPGELTPKALKAAGIDPADVSHVFVTHAHGDHYDYFSAFPNAKMVINETEFEQSFHSFPEDVMVALRRRGSLQIVENEEVVPGIRTVQLGCHTEGSQGIIVQTYDGPVLVAGDVVYMYDNIEQDRPGRSPNPDACFDAMAKIRSLADIVLPAHDPETLERWPSGIIGDKPRELVKLGAEN